MAHGTVSLLPEFALPYLRSSVKVIALFLISRLLRGKAFAAALPPSSPYQRDRFWVRRFSVQAAALCGHAGRLGQASTSASWLRRGVIVVRDRAPDRIAGLETQRRPGYVGEVFTNPSPLALAFVAVAPQCWWMLPLTSALRTLAAFATAGWILHDRLTARFWYLVPLQDLLSFGFWIAGFFGSTIEWRGREYYLRKDGKFELRSES